MLHWPNEQAILNEGISHPSYALTDHPLPDAAYDTCFGVIDLHSYAKQMKEGHHDARLPPETRTYFILIVVMGVMMVVISTMLVFPA